MTRKIVTHHEYPPIPVREFDWCAHYEGEEEAGNYGWGATEAEAIADFNENRKADHDERLVVEEVAIDEVDMAALDVGEPGEILGVFDDEPIVLAIAAAADYRALVAHGWAAWKARQIVADAAAGDPDARHFIACAHGKGSTRPDAMIAHTMFGRLP